MPNHEVMGASETQEAPKAKEQKEAKPKTASQKLREAVRKLEKSDIAGELKELMHEWNHHHIKDAEARQIYLEKVNNKGDKIKLGELLEAMLEIYVGNNPEVLKKIEANRQEELPKAYEVMFDELFQWALSVNKGKDREQARRKIEHIKRRFYAAFE